MKMFNKLMLSAIVVCSFAMPVSAIDVIDATNYSLKSECEMPETVKELYAIAKTGQNVERIPELIKAGVDINTKDTFTCNVMTPLQYASENGHLPVVQALISAGADLNISSKTTSSPLHLAASSGHLDIVKALVAAGADVKAVTKKINYGLSWDLGQPYGYTAVHFAAIGGHRQIIDFLSSAGADINATTNCGYTPLHFASVNGDSAIAEILVRKGANANAVDNFGQKPSDWAANERK